MKPVKAVKPPTSTTLRTVEELCDHALVPREWMPALAKVAARYAVAITPAIAGLIDPSDPHDPIAKQFVPDARELAARPQERGDPIGDDAFSPVEGVVHRYPDRVLLKLVNACAGLALARIRPVPVASVAPNCATFAIGERTRSNRRAWCCGSLSPASASARQGAGMTSGIRCSWLM